MGEATAKRHGTLWREMSTTAAIEPDTDAQRASYQ